MQAARQQKTHIGTCVLGLLRTAKVIENDNRDISRSCNKIRRSLFVFVSVPDETVGSFRCLLSAHPFNDTTYKKNDLGYTPHVFGIGHVRTMMSLFILFEGITETGKHISDGSANNEPNSPLSTLGKQVDIHSFCDG